MTTAQFIPNNNQSKCCVQVLLKVARHAASWLVGFAIQVTRKRVTCAAFQAHPEPSIQSKTIFGVREGF